MLLVFEIARPCQLVPGIFRAPGATILRIYWLWFALSIHPMRFDEMLEQTRSGILCWQYKEDQP